MRHVKVLGTGCASCRNTLTLVRAVADDLGVAIELDKVEDLQQFVKYGVMRTPAVVVDEQLVHVGGVPTREKVAGWLRPATTA
jgi:small redox-active disulfide protein 2